jgi:hypothetical protein
VTFCHELKLKGFIVEEKDFMSLLTDDMCDPTCLDCEKCHYKHFQDLFYQEMDGLSNSFCTVNSSLTDLKDELQKLNKTNEAIFDLLCEIRIKL